MRPVLGREAAELVRPTNRRFAAAPPPVPGPAVAAAGGCHGGVRTPPRGGSWRASAHRGAVLRRCWPPPSTRPPSARPAKAEAVKAVEARPWLGPATTKLGSWLPKAPGSIPGAEGGPLHEGTERADQTRDLPNHQSYLSTKSSDTFGPYADQHNGRGRATSRPVNGCLSEPPIVDPGIRRAQPRCSPVGSAGAPPPVFEPHFC